MKNLKTQEKIIENWKDNISKPLVSIICPAYNHEFYIGEALNGFLIQETNFPFEIIIHDDASTDHTADIIREYETKYPKLIRAVYQTVNRFSQGKKNGEILYPMAKGKYVALCDGDDYWTDPLKLQKQVKFLEENKDYVISGHDAFIVDENGKHLQNSKLPDAQKKDFNTEELILSKAWILTLSWVFRKEAIANIPNELNKVLNVDTFLTSLIGNYGHSKYHTDIKPAGYRVHSGGIWSLLSKQDKLDASLNTFFWMYRYYKRIGKEKYANYYLLKYNQLVIARTETYIIIKELKTRTFSYILNPIKNILRPFKNSIFSILKINKAKK